MKDTWKEIFKQHNLDKCKYCKSDRYIELHHIKDKKYNIANMTRMVVTPERLKELKKCIPLCPRCHKKIHREENNDI